MIADTKNFQSFQLGEMSKLEIKEGIIDVGKYLGIVEGAVSMKRDGLDAFQAQVLKT